MSSTPTLIDHAASQRISARIDRLPRLTRSHRAIMAILVALFAFDLIDIGTLASVLPAVREEWELSLEAVGVLTSSTFVGMVIGAVVGGRVADRIGRRPTLSTVVLIFSIGSLLSAFATGPVFLGVARIITGIGIGATSGTVLVIISEMFPKPLRGRMVAVIYGVAGLTGPLMAVAARLLVPNGLWHVIFLIGSVGFVFALIAIKVLPESPRWLAARGQEDRADAAVARFEQEYRAETGSELPEPVVLDAQPPAKGALVDIFRLRFLGRTVAASLLFLGATILNYGLGSWLPVILVERGYPQTDAYNFLIVLSIGYVVGALGASSVIDRFERKWLILTLAIVLGACYLVIGFVNAVPVLLAVGFLATLVHNAITTTVFTYAPEIFPVEIRGQGAGFANGIGRLGGILNSLVIGFVIATFATEGVFVYLAAVCVFIVAVASFGPRMGIREAWLARRRIRADAAAGARVVPDPLA